MKNIEDLKGRYSTFHSKTSSSVHEQLQKLPEGQSPKFLLITCSDSRIEPGFLFHSNPGEVFTIRNAGNIVPTENSGELGTIQFAVDVLKVQHIIVCGHTDCGAVKGMLNPDSVKGLDCLESWLCSCSKKHDLDSNISLTENIKTHVLNQEKSLMSLDFVKEKVESGALSIMSCILDLSNYKIDAYSREKDCWVDLAAV